ncbi:hypothetical protein EJ02DRAFT_488767 [Clathrospora elynae]|uniref:Uncharacterized protein n=1 Tax=Clathrospora elynae TaxID=706981 RepID=A0A6A5S254_9PLEO|nr:hypothetical protein EJ02DRAFT_488767 [Clathrospora elynae]
MSTPTPKSSKTLQQRCKRRLTMTTCHKSMPYSSITTMRPISGRARMSRRMTTRYPVQHKATAAAMHNILKDLNSNTIHANRAIAWHNFVTLQADNCKTI